MIGFPTAISTGDSPLDICDSIVIYNMS